MHLVVTGLNHKTAPVEVREKLSVHVQEPAEMLGALKACGTADECLLLSTCNRLEVYACTSSRAGDASVVEWMCSRFGMYPQELSPHLFSLSGHEAAEHLFRVASGLDSMVLGEAQILGQVKDAYAAASGSGLTGNVLNSLFQQAIRVGKRARTETEIGRGAFSVGSVAVQLARSIFGELKERTVLVVGAGEMSELMTAHLISMGVKRVLVVNRTYEKAELLASRFGGEPVMWGDLHRALVSADVVMTSTGAERPVITADMVSFAMRVRRGRPVFCIDIAVPRDIEAGVSGIDNVFLYDIDDLQAAVNEQRTNRQSEVAKVELIIAEEVREFVSWFRTLDAVPLIVSLRDRFEQIRQTEVQKIESKLKHLSPEDRQVIDAATRSIVNRICHQPMIRIKEYAAAPDSTAKLDILCEVFGICPVDDGTNVAEPGKEEG